MMPPVVAFLLLALILHPCPADAYYGTQRHQGPAAHLRGREKADNYTCYHAPTQPGVRVG